MKITKPTHLDYGKEAAEKTIEVILKDKLTGEIVGAKRISKAELAKALQPFGRTCHTAINGKFILEV